MPASILNVGAAVVGFYVSESKLINTANNSILCTPTHKHTKKTYTFSKLIHTSTCLSNIKNTEIATSNNKLAN